MKRQDIYATVSHLIDSDKENRIVDHSAYMRSVDEVQNLLSLNAIDDDRAEEMIIETLAAGVKMLEKIAEKKQSSAQSLRERLDSNRSRVLQMLTTSLFVLLVFSIASCSPVNRAYQKYYAPYGKQKAKLAKQKRADFCRPKPHRVRL